MNSDQKIKWVRDKVYEQEKLVGLGVANYSLVPVVQEVGDFIDILAIFDGKGANKNTPNEKVVVITVDEQIDILKRLEKEKLIEILELNKESAVLKVFPPQPSPVKLKVLEHIARSLADVFTGSQILDTLLDYGIARADIPYPDTKWRTLQNMFLALATSPNPEQREKFGGAITTFLHPLNFNADESVSHKLIADFNNYLKYDGYEIVVADDGDGYKLAPTANKTKVAPPIKPLTEEEKAAERVAQATPAPSRLVPSPLIAESEEYIGNEVDDDEYSEQVESETHLLRQPKVAEHLAVTREAYKTLMAIVSSFCVDPTTPSQELNTAYTELTKVVVEELRGFCGDASEFAIFSFDEHKKSNFGIPFGGLYSAEFEFKKKGRQMHWDEIRPEMNAVLGQIEEVCQTANAPDVIAEPKIQKIIGDTMLLLSQTAAERKSTNPTSTEPMKMEIVKFPPLQLSKAESDRKGLYVVKKNNDFYHNGHYLNLSKRADYYKVFSALYAKLPDGGEVPYKELIAEVKSRLPKTQDKTDDEMKKFIQRNLTDKGNGFIRYAGIPQTEDNGKPLIEITRGVGVVFNNKSG